MVPALVICRDLNWKRPITEALFKLLYVGWVTMAAYVNLHAGVGKPLWEITIGEYSVWFKGIIGSAWLYPAMTASIRTSILLFYYRLFGTPGVSRLKWVIKVMLVLQVIYLVVYSILPAFICRPLYMAWHPLERQLYFKDWYYYNIQVALYSTSMAFDVVLLVLPLYPVWQLQLPIRKRASIAFVLMLGAAASIAAAYKLAIFVVEMARYTHINPKWLQYEMSTLIPPQFDTYGTTFWIPSQVEPTVALIGTSLPALRQSIISATQRVPNVWSLMSFNSTSRTKHGSSDGVMLTHSSSQRSRPLVVPEPKAMRRSDDSEVALQMEYTQLNDLK
ncbi:hypothetical protein MMC12_008309 [Toensbergia leucococca]|nr:hypothetical protein [Toensbergia leucococca]